MTVDQDSKPKTPDIALSKTREGYIWIYTSTFALIGLSIIVVGLFHLPADTTGLLLFIVMAAIAEIFSVELYVTTQGSRVSVASTVALAGAFAFGPLAGALINAGCGLISTISSLIPKNNSPQKKPALLFRRAIFNIGMLVISTTISGLVFIYLGGKIGQILDISAVIPIILAVTTNEMVNVLILLGVLRLQTGKSIGQLWAQNFSWGIPIGIFGGVIGSGALAAAYDMFTIEGAAVFFVPILSMSYSFQLYISKTKGYIDQLENLNRQLDETNVGLLESFGAIIDAYDEYTFGHSAQVAVYAEAIAREMEMTEQDRSILVKAALIHDIGKIGITDTITHKPGALTIEEKTIMNRHPVIGADILRKMKGLQKLVPIVRHHHEHWDGSGYPAGLAGEEIPIGARILAVADAMEAMFSERPYHPPRSFEEVHREILRCAGTQFDPVVVAAYVRMTEKVEKSFFKNTAVTINHNLLSNPSPLFIKNLPLVGSEPSA